MVAKIISNDIVYITTGDDKGKIGKVLQVIYDKCKNKKRRPKRVVVSGIGMKHIFNKNKREKLSSAGKSFKQERSIDISNVMFWDEDSKSFGRLRINNEKKRVFIPSGKLISDVI
ncbi:50S ribosomal protein L24 [Anaplasmataceae bacterium AB001_6]|nr:50S ribosomal protein L24 [Anaplasmataceae bacterium AB001_6]